MNKLLLLSFILISLFPFSLHSQGVLVGAQPSNGDKHYYVGSLLKSNTNPHGKLKIEVFGGNVHNSNLGTVIFTISTRDGLKIHREVRNGSSSNYELNIFDTGNTYDFTIRIPSHWASIWIQAYSLNPPFDGIPRGMSSIQIKEYDTSEVKNITDQFSINTIVSTFYAGDIGIGTLTPQSKLDVRGKVIADEVEIKVNKGADFVFDSDYNLPSLSEVENHIKENKHLPDIPSEKEMVENGINVNEMQIKLLQKIEELTLYVIELDKKDKEKSRLIEELQNKIKD